MARANSYIGVTDVADRLVVLRQCPITCGRPTRMTDKGVTVACERFQRVARGELSEYGHQLPSTASKAWCLVCKGEQRPPELEIIDAKQFKEIEDMASQRYKGTCEACGNTDIKVGRNYGLMMCTNCNTTFAAVNNRLEVVAQALIRTKKVEELVARLGGEPLRVEMESKVLDKIKEVVGYAGSDEDGLVAAVRGLVADRKEMEAQLMGGRGGKSSVIEEVCKALDLEDGAEADDILGSLYSWREAYNEFLSDNALFRRDLADALDVNQDALDSQLIEAIRALVKDFYHMRAKAADINAAKDCDTCAELGAMIDITRHSGLSLGTGSDQVSLAVAQMAAVIDEAMNLAGDYAQHPTDLPFLVKKQGEELRRMGAELKMMKAYILEASAEQEESERQLLAVEQIFAKIREIIGADSISYADLPTAIETAIHNASSLKSFRESNRAELDSQLLGLLLDQPGIGVDRIRAIREAA